MGDHRGVKAEASQMEKNEPEPTTTKIQGMLECENSSRGFFQVHINDIMPPN